MLDKIKETAKEYHDNQIKELSDELVKQKDKAYLMRRQIANLEDELLEKRHELSLVYNTIGNIVDKLQDELNVMHSEYKN